jgi:hypothetical protein
MKQLYIILLVFGVSVAQAQIYDGWKNEIESIFQHVNRNHVTTGLLTDYGIYFTNIDKFNGIPSDTNYIELTEWQSLYLSLYTCRFNSNATIPEPVEVFDLLDTLSKKHSGIILLAGLHINYDRFKDNALSSNLVYVSNNKIYDTPNRPTTPYEIRDAFAFTPNQAMLTGGSHQFMFKPELLISNTGKTVAGLQVDFGNGQGYQTVLANTPIGVNYATEGEKVLRFKISYTDNSFRESRTKIFVSEIVNPAASYRGIDTLEFVFPRTGFPSPKVYQGKVARARVTVEFANPGQVIRRPLIVVEGFDGWNILTPENRNTNFSFIDFISPNQDGGINRVIDYNHNGTFYSTLSDALEGEDFDLIFVDFADATDYIQRNAYLVENIIEWVNSVKQPYNGVMQKNVVIGFSMGGLVARYALRDMELDNKTHDTRLYCSFDSPHQGANIPVGFQAMVSHLSGVGIGFGLPGITYSPGSLTLGRLFPQLGRAQKLLNRPAARQMIKYSVVGGGHFIFHNNSIHETFMNEYSQLGYPQQGGIRNIVIASGSECGTNQGFAPYATFMSLNESQRLPYLLNLVGNLFSPVFLLTTYPQLAIGGSILTTRTDVKVQFVVNALPNQSTQRLYKGKFWVKRKILFVINTNTTLFDKEFHSLSSYLPLDNSSGGVYDMSQFAVPPALMTLFNITRFNFIPTYSALDVGGGQQSIALTDITRSYSPSSPPASPKNVIATNFFTNPTEAGFSNQIHTQVTLRNGRWLFQEIVGQPVVFSCSYVCSSSAGGPVISGSDLVCSSGATAFSLNNHAATTTTWSAWPSNRFITSSGTGTFAQLQASSSIFTGSASITYTIQGACTANPLTVTKSFWMGRPSGIINGPWSVYPGQIYNYYASTTDGSYDWNWSVSGGGFIFGAGTPHNFVTVWWNTDGVVELWSTNGCGTTFGSLNITVTMEGGCDPCQRNRDEKETEEALTDEEMFGLIAAYPNPSVDKIMVLLKQDIEIKEPFMVTVHDISGRIIKSFVTDKRKFEIDLKDNSNGLYIVNTRIQNTNLSIRIQKE